MAAQFLINGAARLLAPTAAAFALAYLSRRSIILYGSLAILASSAMFWWNDKRDPAVAQSRTKRLVEENA
jgi:hypothetical protein